MGAPPLSPEAVRRNAAKLTDELGRADRDRLELLLAIMQADGRINLGDALNELYPEQKREAALMLFRQYRKRLTETAAGAGILFSFEADSRKKTPPKERWCWFEGEDRAAETITRLVHEESYMVQRTAQSGIEYRGNKELIRYFISYAHDDYKAKNELCPRLKKLFDSDPDYLYEEWHDGLILPGDRWREQIERAIANCHFGLLLVSPSFLASKFIANNELPAFVPQGLSTPDQGKRTIPVAIEPLLFDGSMDLKGLQHLQIFHDSDRKAYDERSGNKKREFIRQLFTMIRQVVTLRISAPEKPPLLRSHVIEQRLRHDIECAIGDGCVVPPEAFSSTLEKLDASDRGEKTPRQRIDALNFIKDWVADPKAPHYFALLGELGIGKTTTCLALSKQLLDLRANDPKIPLPIYMDLRLLGEQAASSASLEDILSVVIRKKWHGGHLQIDVGPEEIVRLVQREGALAIFDGLDEVLVHLTPRGEQRFLRELLRLLPPHLFREEKTSREEPKNLGRLLLSCRTHYFPTLRAQKNLLLGEGREGVAADDYRALVLLPFSEEQIISYLKQTLPDQDPEKVLDTIRVVHNLSEMAERPYTLSLIAREIPQIEQWKMEGRRVTGVTLYRHMAQSWLERDAGKHILTPTHKKRIMEYFAAELWRSGRRAWNVDDVEQWLIDFLLRHPEIAAHYEGKDRELLKEDLRTATFLVREGEDQFRFAHTSLLEFFLACHLHRGLIEEDTERWGIPKVSRETYDFLGQLLTEDQATRNKALSCLRVMLTREYQPKVSEQALSYALLAHERGHPSSALAGARMEGADLRGLEFHGKPGVRLNLRSAVWRGTRLERASFRYADLEGADFTEAFLDRSEFIRCHLVSALFSHANLAGVVFREAQLKDADFIGGRFHRTKWLKCDLTDTTNIAVSAPDAFFALSQPELTYTPLAGTSVHTFIRHGSESGTCFSPDGGRLATASDHGSVWLWDVDSGEQLVRLCGHQGGVCCVAWAADGRRLASAGDDGSVRIWDADSGEQLAGFLGHVGGIRGVTWEASGRRLASAGDDGSVRIWDADCGEQLAVLSGHKGPILGVAWEASGRRLASAGKDGSVRIWNADSGDQLTELLGHVGGIRGVTWEASGRRLASAGDDGSVRIWDAASGEQLAVLSGHKGVVYGVAWEASGRRLASAGDDKIVRIWDADSGEELVGLLSHPYGVRGVAWEASGRRLAAVGSITRIRIWDTDSWERLELGGHIGGVWGVTWDASGRRLASCGDSKDVIIWDADSGERLAELRGHNNEVICVAWEASGKRLASAGYGGSVCIWNVDSGKQLVELSGHYGPVFGVAWEASGRRLASASKDGTVRIWDADSGEQLAEFSSDKGGYLCVAWDASGRRLAAAGSEVHIWDTLSGEQLAVLAGHVDSFLSVTWEASGRRLASAGNDGSVRIWDADSGVQLAELPGHKHGVMCVTWEESGKRLASADGDGTLRIWDADSGEQLAELPGHEGCVYGVVWEKSGRRLASVGDDGSMRLWDVSTGQEIRQTYMFDEDSWAVIDPANNRIVQVGGEAWRWLGWSGIDPATGRLERWPAEIYGPLPEWLPNNKAGRDENPVAHKKVT